MKRWITASLVSASLVAGGCAAGRSDFILLNPGTHPEPLAESAPVLLTVGDLNGPYQEVGVIHVSGVSREGYEGLSEKMREEARRMGADAIIYVRYGTVNAFSIIPFFVAFPYDVLTAEGLAVRSKRR
ncbi:MAG: hypothetical protein HY353_03550 [Candidatus Omnitrophica bacterium]|nr:hypothetical protein [Candidatus Omnitrophota bacterium]